MNDIVINKVQSIHRCVERAREEYNLATEFKTDYSRQDAAVLNITRASEQAIDLSNHLIKTHKMGIPDDSAGVFRLLEKKSVISAELSKKLQNMVAFRNTVVHEYQKINLDIVIAVIKTGLDDLIEFTESIMEFTAGGKASR